ncbi:MAG: PAS domain S-box protein [Methylobacter sp.]|nr:PAS domain S-box protein [Methylobacter sp.]
MLFALSGAAYADNALEQWRNKADEIRLLAENDTQRAYAEAERLQVELPAEATPADRARLLNLLARIEMNLAETDKAALHIRQAMEIARQHNDPVGQAEADLNTALNAVNQAKIDDAIAAADHALAVLDGVDRPDLLGEALLRMAMMYRRFNQFDESVTMALQAMDIARQSNNPLVLAYAHHGLAITYEQSERYAEALEQYERMLEQAKLTGSGLMQAYALMGLGQCARGLGNLKASERKLREAIAIFHEVGSPFNLNFGLYGLADTLRLQGRHAETLPLLDEAVARYQRYSNKIGLWWTLNARSRSRMALGDDVGSRRDVEQAYALAEEIGVPVYLTDSAKRLAEIAAANGDHHQAYRFMREASELAAKMAKDTAAMRVLQLTRRYQTESKQREIDKLNRRNQQQAAKLERQSLERRWLWTVLGGSVIMLVGTAFFLVRLRRSHRRLAKLNTKALQAKNKLQATLDAIPDLMFEVGLDGRYYDCHSPQSDLLAAPAEQLLGRTVAEVMSADAAAVCLAALREAHEKSISFGKQLLLSLPHGDCWFELSVAAKPAVTGEEPRFVVMSRNITERKQMDDALRISRQTLTEAQRIAHVGSWELDLETNALSWSDEIFRIFEIDQEQFGASYQFFIEIIHSDDRETVNRVYVDSVKNREPYQIEHRLLMPDGRVKHVLERCETAYADDGKPLRSLGTVQDITERKYMEAQTLQREQEFRVLVEHSPDLIFRYDKDCRRIYANPAVARLVGRPSDALLNSTPSEAKILSDEEADKLMQMIRQVLLTSLPAESEVECMGVDGQLHYFHNRYAPEFNAHGEVVSVISIARDITERKQAADALAAREREFRALAESLPDNILRYDREGRLVYVNHVLERTLGVTAADMLGTKVRELFPHGEYDDYAQLLDAVLADGESREMERTVPIPNKNSHEIHNIRFVAEYDRSGEVIGALAIGRDMTERKQAERRLWLMDFALNQVGEAVYIINLPSLGFISVNDEACRALGYSREELLGMTVYDIDPDADPKDMTNLQSEIDATDLTVFERRHKTKDGHIFPVEINAKVFDYEGRPTSIALARDITERKRAEHDIALMSQALNKVHEAAYMMDDDAGFLYVNEAACRALGYSRDELLTMSVMDIGPGWTLEMVGEVWQRQREIGTMQSFDASHRRKDGSIFPVEINANQFEYDGKTYGLALVRDISERKRSEDEIRALNADLERRVLERTEKLRQQTRYLRTLIDTLPMMAWLKDRENRFLVVNQPLAAASSYEMEDLVGKSDLDCWPSEYAESYRSGDLEVMATGLRKTREELFVDARNNLIWVESFKAPVLDEDGSVLGTVGIARDISDRKAMETARDKALAEAERLAQLRSEFMARMSHELRTPLNGIMGYAQILLRENRDNERHSTMLNVIWQSGEYLLNLINDILDFAKIEAGKQELSLSDIPLARFLRNLASIITIKAEQKGLAFVCDIAVDVPAGIRADEKRLRQVLLNLLSNAVKYSERGQISLKVTVLEPGRLRFEVQDSGIGIDAGQLETIFHAFEQAGDWQHRTGGTGLGLPISRELARMMGSDIQVASRVGEGSTFWFDLDISVVELCDNSVDAEQPIVGYQGLRRRVLVVGNGNENRGLLPETELLPQYRANEPLVVPPLEEMTILHRLAQEGSMRDIIRQTAHLEELDPRYRPFAAQLRTLAQGYQSKAILDFVQRYINSTGTVHD